MDQRKGKWEYIGICSIYVYNVCRYIVFLVVHIIFKQLTRSESIKDDYGHCFSFLTRYNMDEV
jgi:hypothetical protein